MKIRDVNKIIDIDENFCPEGKILVLDKFYIIETTTICPQCKNPTKVIAFGYDKHYDFYYEAVRSYGIIISPVPELPNEISDFLHKYNYHVIEDNHKEQYILQNYCPHCEYKFDTHETYEDGDGPFDLQEITKNKLILYSFKLNLPLLIDPLNEIESHYIYESASIENCAVI